jgi:hypothetical protein
MALEDLAVKPAQSVRTLMTHFIRDHCPMRAAGLRTFVENARSLGIAGLVFFIVTSVLLFNAVSTVFNTVWGCTYRRLFLARGFRRGNGPATVSECSEERYLPARPLNSIRMAEVITALFGVPERTPESRGKGKLRVEGYLDGFLDAGTGSGTAENEEGL